eukprot:324660_1
MWAYISLAFSLNLLGASASRASSLLDNCNWIFDENPDDGTYPGYYALDLANPHNNCNQNGYFNSDGTLVDKEDPTNAAYDPTYDPNNDGPNFSKMNYWYECTEDASANPTVTKYMCLDNANGCDPLDVGDWGVTGCHETVVYTEDDAVFNCDPGASEACLMQYTLYFNQDDTMQTCNPDSSKAVHVHYGVNGACEAPNNANVNELVSCSDDQVVSGGVSGGILYEEYNRDSTDCVDFAGGSYTWEVGTCNDYWGGPDVPNGVALEINTCEGSYEQCADCDGGDGGDDGGPPDTNGDIDDLHDCDQCETACVENTLSMDMGGGNMATFGPCEWFGDGIFSDIGNCQDLSEMGGLEGYASMYCEMLSDHIPIDCVDSGILPFATCVLDEGCYTERIDESKECQQQCLVDHGCVNDTTCMFLRFDDTSPINLDDGPQFDAIHYECENNYDCSVFKPTLACMMLCHEGSDDNDDDDDFCPTLDKTAFMQAYFTCFLDSDCYEASQAVFDFMFDDESSECDHTLCGPGMLADKKSVHCTAFPDQCGALFDTIYDLLYGCFAAECPWANCGDEIEACQGDADCNEDLLFVVNIEDNFEAASDGDFFNYVKEYYCHDKGGCHALLEPAYACVIENECIEFETTECWETECSTEVAACADPTVGGDCFGVVLDIMKNDTECKEMAREMYGCDCDGGDGDDGGYDRNMTMNMTGWDYCDVYDYEHGNYDDGYDGNDYTQCQGHYGPGGDDATMSDPELSWCCNRCNCMDLSDRADDSECGFEGNGTDWNGSQGNGTDWNGSQGNGTDCEEICDECDSWFDGGAAGCGDGQCGTAFVDLMVCIGTQCSESDNSDDCGSRCAEYMYPCRFDEACSADFAWVENEMNMDDDEMLTFAYPETTLAIPGCSIAELMALDGDDPASEIQFMGCKYQDMRAYCTSGDGTCSDVFYGLLTCMFAECGGYTTPEPTTAEP